MSKTIPDDVFLPLRLGYLNLGVQIQIASIVCLPRNQWSPIRDNSRNDHDVVNFTVGLPVRVPVNEQEIARPGVPDVAQMRVYSSIVRKYVQVWRARPRASGSGDTCKIVGPLGPVFDVERISACQIPATIVKYLGRNIGAVVGMVWVLCIEV